MNMDQMPRTSVFWMLSSNQRQFHQKIIPMTVWRVSRLLSYCKFTFLTCTNLIRHKYKYLIIVLQSQQPRPKHWTSTPFTRNNEYKRLLVSHINDSRYSLMRIFYHLWRERQRNITNYFTWSSSLYLYECSH